MVSTVQPEPAAPRRPLARRLGFRLAVALSLGTLALLAAASIWNLQLQRQHLTRMVERRAASIVDIMAASTRQSMLENDASELRRQLSRFAAVPDIERVRVFDKQGQIRHSSDGGEVGRMVDLNAEQCISCHAADQPLVHLDIDDRSRIFERPGQGRVIGVILPIANEASCYGGPCHAHSAQQTILGVLDVQLSLASVDRSIRTSERQLLFGMVGTGLAVLALAWLLVWRFVLRPVGALTAAAPKVAGGDFATRVPARRRDELGELAESFNRMAAELGATHAELEDWGRTLEQRVDAKSAELAQAHQQMIQVEKMASLGKLAAIVAHELNNPLAGVATYAKLLQRRVAEVESAPAAEGESDFRRILHLIETEALRCGNIVKNLLLFSRTPTAVMADAELAPIVERVALLVQHQADLREIELVRDLPAGLPRVPCDAAQIQQMLLALVMNALEATPQGGRVAIGARARDGRMLLAVSDTGRGIPPEVLPQIFEPFFTTKEAGAGVGLGLAVVYGIVERHGGHVSVASEPGGGTTFTVDLPLDRPAEAAGGEASR